MTEVQLHHSAIKNFEAGNHSHKHYEFFRSYFNGDAKSIEKRLEALRALGNVAWNDLEDLVAAALSSSDTSTLEAVSTLLNFLSETDYAIQVEERLLALMREKEGEEERIAATLNNLGELVKQTGRFEKSLLLFEESLELYRKLVNGNPLTLPLLATSLNNYAGLLVRSGKPEVAEPLYAESLGIYRSQFGDQHPETARILNNLGLLLKQKGDMAEAEALYKVRRREARQNRNRSYLYLLQVFDIFYLFSLKWP